VRTGIFEWATSPAGQGGPGRLSRLAPGQAARAGQGGSQFDHGAG